jgi:hypothetical protein
MRAISRLTMLVKLDAKFAPGSQPYGSSGKLGCTR